jgi:hypothetical protein
MPERLKLPSYEELLEAAEQAMLQSKKWEYEIPEQLGEIQEKVSEPDNQQVAA